MTATRMQNLLLGREPELSVLEARLADLRNRGVAVLVRGHVGVGKSALLAAASDRAESDGVRVLRVSAARAESEMAYAGLHQMLRPLFGRVAGLPEPQRKALLATFGMQETSAPSALLVALAVLELLVKEAENVPLLVVVDDGHWLDPPTADVLGVVARRLESEPVALVIAVRDGYETRLGDLGFEELCVEALDEPSSVALLDSTAPGLGSDRRRRMLTAAAGNPLALVELAAAVGARSTAGYDLPEGMPMTHRLRQALVERTWSLPAVTQAALLVVSLDAQTRVSEALTAAALLDEDTAVGRDGLAPAVAAGLVELDHDHVRFCHPLTAAAVYQGATPVLRRRAHAALAASLIDHPFRRAWHRAASTDSPDEDVAAELEHAALGKIIAEVATSTAATVERAAELTPDTSRRRQRLLRAAELAVEFGDVDRATRLLGETDAATCEPVDRARRGLVQDLLEPAPVTDPQALESLVAAATRASSAGEIRLALRLLRAAALRTWWSDPGDDARGLVIAAAQRVPTPEGDPAVPSILAVCDPAGHAEILNEVASHTMLDTCDPEAAYMLGTGLHMTGAFTASSRFLTAAVAGLRAQGRLWLLPQALAQHSWNAIYSGNWSVVDTAAEEAVRGARETHQPLWEAAAETALSVIAAIRGDDASAEALLGDAEAIALPLGARAVLADIQLARALLALGRGRYDEAYQHLHRTFDPRDPAHHHFRSSWRIGEYAEAAMRAGHVDEAREQLANVEAAGRQTLSPRLQIGLLYARPLVADDDGAEPHFQAALSENLASWPMYRGRVLLEYGSWLRRHRRIAEARMPLRAARDVFDALGATPWADRARQELRASRETRPHRRDSWMDLTEQEQQIVQLTAQGLTNREVGERLYISHRTVGAHLYHIFPKLGIASRGQLSTVIGMLPPARLAS